MMARLKWYLDPSCLHQLKTIEKIKTILIIIINVVKVGLPLTTLSGSAHGSSSKLRYHNLTRK